MQNPHIIVGRGNRCLCGTYNIGGESKAVSCRDIIDAYDKLRDDETPEGILIFTVLRELVADHRKTHERSSMSGDDLSAKVASDFFKHNKRSGNPNSM